MENTTHGTGAIKREIFQIPATQKPQTTKLRVAGYARVSSDSDDQLNSFASQVNYYTHQIEQNPSWELAGIYADEGITGVSTEKREDFLRMMQDCREGKIDRILTKSTSRFSRNTMDSLATIRELKALGISVYFEKEGIDTASITSESLLTLYALVSQQESINISQNCKRANRMRMQRGTYISSNPPYGYRLVDGELCIHEEEAEIVERIFKEYLLGQGTNQIAKALTDEGVVSKFNSQRWRAEVIAIVLRNERYKGDMLLQKYYREDALPYQEKRNDGDLPQYYVKDTHPAIVSHLQYELANLLLQQRSIAINVNCTTSLLTSKIRCKECNKNYRRKKTRGIVYWTCIQHEYDKSHCPALRIPEDTIYRAFLHLYHKLKANQATILEPMVASLTKLQEQTQRENSQLQTINKQIASLAEQNRVMSGLLSKGTLDSALFLSKTDQLKKALADEKQKKARLLASLQQDSTLEQTQALLHVLSQGPDQLTQMDETIFEDMIDHLETDGVETIHFILKNGLKLTERL